MMRTQGVLFDLYGTLIVYGDMEKAWNAWFKEIYKAFLDSGLTMSPEAFRPHCVGFFEKPEPKEEKGQSVVERRLKRLAKEMNVDISRERGMAAIEKSIDVWHDQVRLDPEAQTVLQEIRKDRSLALVSNFDYAPYVQNLMVRWNLAPMFDTILVSDAVGVKKPHPGIFDEALKRLGLRPDQVMHVGDSQEDIEGAAGAGIRPVWIDRQRKDPWRAKHTAHLPNVTRITSLRQLLFNLD